MRPNKPKPRMVYQARFPVAMREQLKQAARNLDLSLNAYVAKLLGESAKVTQELDGNSSMPEGDYCSPYSLRLPAATMLFIQDRALQGGRFINDEIMLRLKLAMHSEVLVMGPFTKSAAWYRLIAAIDETLRLGHPDGQDHLMELGQAREELEKALEAT